MGCCTSGFHREAKLPGRLDRLLRGRLGEQVLPLDAMVLALCQALKSRLVVSILSLYLIDDKKVLHFYAGLDPPLDPPPSCDFCIAFA